VDRNGFSALTQTPLDVVNVPPAIELVPEVTIRAGTSIALAGSFTDPGNDTWTAWVDYGDGSGEQPLALNGKSFFLDRPYTRGGLYELIVTVEDDDEGAGSDSILVTVENQPPVAQCQDIVLSADANCTASGSVDNGSSDPDGDAITLVQTPAGPYPLGMTEVSLQVTDSFEASSSCMAKVTVVDDTPPVIVCPANIAVECAESGGTAATDAAIAQFLAQATAADACGTTTLSQNAPAFFTLGSSVLTFTAEDAAGNLASCTGTVTIDDTIPPQLSVSVNPDTLWPPNHKMTLIQSTLTVTDQCDAAPIIQMSGIQMNEGDETDTYDPGFDLNPGDGNTTNDIQVDSNGDIYLRAERKGDGDGRVYTINYTASDASNNSNAANATVTVPHNQ
jgi:hypothetical protein